MRFVLIAAAVVVLSGQALAQGKSRPNPPPQTGEDGERQKRMEREEAAAKAAMKNIPDSKEKYDPWKIGK